MKFTGLSCRQQGLAVCNSPSNRLPRSHVPRRRFRSRASGAGGGPEGEGELIDFLRKEISRKQETEDTVNKVVEEEKQKLREAAEKVKENIEAMKRFRMEQAEESFDKALEELDAMSSQAEEEIEERRKQTEKNEAEFYEWEKKMTEARNEGHFFKGLYKSQFEEQRKKKKKDGDDKKRT